ncbi:hypothetical protein [Aliikangiella sp. IMCC44359]|uniref:hypothetical protein n=1 Tax=Aliikangiella sp. IMCC44359 TaxID=3459125 RepID=UPI00403AD2D4
MNYLRQEQAVLEKYLPNFIEKIDSLSLLEMEGTASPVIKLFKENHGPKLVIPKQYGGHGATAVELVRFQRMIGSISPSLAIASNMHHFSVATLVEMAKNVNGMEWMILEAIAKENLLVASAFAEGRAGSNILEPFLELTPSENGGYYVSGSKKPCSLSHSMDLLTFSAILPDANNEKKIGVVLVASDVDGIKRKEFWGSDLFKASESEEIILDKVHIHEQLVSYAGNLGELDDVQTRGFIWFELLLCASYVGILSGLVKRVLLLDHYQDEDVAEVLYETETATSALEGLAVAIENQEKNESLLSRSLHIRYAIQRATERASARAVELLGGMQYIQNPEISYLYSAVRALAFHPPSRYRMTKNLVNYMKGQPLIIS